MEITEHDIKRVELIFFNGNGSFEDDKSERYQFISCINKSIDLEACPGSGKTTSLLAKLYLLSEKMPFENGRGICVLTHTNVAINEIKNRLRVKADRLFQYPNFFGTIQSFVDKYLAIPSYVNKYRKRPYAIDSQRAANRLKSTYLEYNLRDKVKKVKSFLYANELFDKLTFKRTETGKYTIVKGINGEQVELKKPRSRTDWSADDKEELLKILFRLKEKIFKESALLSYDDGYFLAEEYLQDFPNIRSAITSRFSHVFIDEMQDTYAHQDIIIKEIFGNDVIIQRTGDSNQAILNDNYSECAWEDSERMKISGSRRFSQPIADILKTVALNGDVELTGSNDATIPPHIIPYEEGKETQVLEEFVSLLHELGLDDDSLYEYPIKAVGWVGKEKDGLTVGTYFTPFNRCLRIGRSSFNNLKSALSLCGSSNPKEIYNTMIDCCLEILRLSGFKSTTSKGQRYYNKTSFIDLLKRNHPETLTTLNAKISLWGQQLLSGELAEILPVIRAYFKDDFFSGLEFGLNGKANLFIDSDEIEGASEEQLESNNIFYSEKSELKHIPVEVGTVHSVKGETHRATLYLETFFYKTCGNYLIDQMTGTKYEGNGGKRKEMCLRIAHVGMSRPTHLLCIALNKNLVDEKRKELEDNGWKII